jgi:acyl-CoA synthetase (AMP-forming)/AMP-acid ligase II
LIVDEEGRACPPGVIGEIYIRTPYRSHGYYKQPELTAQVFIQNPFSNDPNDIVYRTGDLGRLLEDGNLELLGRKDQQVKIRGVRVELEEINSLVRGFSGVQDVAVIDRKDTNGGNFLCAYIVGDGEFQLDTLREYLHERLPGSMVPSAYMLMEELPRTMSGKIDLNGPQRQGRVCAATDCDRTDGGRDLGRHSGTTENLCVRQFLRAERPFVNGNTGSDTSAKDYGR